MARNSLSLPHERRKAKLQAQKLQLRVRLAETKHQLVNVNSELQAMKPNKPKSPTGV